MATPMEELKALMSALPGASLITDGMYQAALDGAQVPDVNGVWPGQPDYIPTYDVFYAALSLLGFLQAQPVVRQSSSEGTSVSVDAPNWSSLAAYYRSMSPICGIVLGGNILTAVPIPGGPHVVHTNMREGINGDDNVDTDLA